MPLFQEFSELKRSSLGVGQVRDLSPVVGCSGQAMGIGKNIVKGVQLNRPVQCGA